uniref:DUF4097 domain-containing protein n=1 Tax=Ganoderma boninense TaxID=34458 RepID=A0A5K1JY33_9APHY|nr:DUF4097 domain-containing protein [Ganoderma boninense]
MSSLTSRLVAVEDDFSAAIIEGGAAITAFNERWDALLIDVDLAFSSSTGLDDETLSIIHTVSTRIAELADASIDLYTTCNLLTSELVSELDKSMSELTLVDTPTVLLSGLSRSHSQPPSFPHQKQVEEPVTKDGKRRRSSHHLCTPQHKRPRLQAAISPATGLFCPPSTITISEWSTLENFANSSSESPTAGPFPRKRRFSETESDSPPPSAGSTNRHVRPRLHAVSDTFATCPSIPLFAHEDRLAQPPVPQQRDEDANVLQTHTNDDLPTIGADADPFPTLIDSLLQSPVPCKQLPVDGTTCTPADFSFFNIDRWTPELSPISQLSLGLLDPSPSSDTRSSPPMTPPHLPVDDVESPTYHILPSTPEAHPFATNSDDDKLPLITPCIWTSDDDLGNSCLPWFVNRPEILGSNATIGSLLDLFNPLESDPWLSTPYLSYSVSRSQPISSAVCEIRA